MSDIVSMTASSDEDDFEEVDDDGDAMVVDESKNQEDVDYAKVKLLAS